MKKNYFYILALITILTFGWQTAVSQITITFPQFPKIKKDKPKKDTTQVTDSREQNSEQTSENKKQTDTVKTAGECSDENDIWLKSHLDEIAERQKEVDSFTPDRGWLAGGTTYDHLLNAVSPKAREKWLQSSKAMAYKDCSKLVTAFDKLAASAANKLPLYLPNTKAYPIHNPIEEKLMKSKISDLADHKIFYTGIQESSWLIDKNDLGIPKSRYKHGLVWVRYVPNDHPYCRIYYINIIQDYAGGGTYGESYGYFVKDQLVGCPSGK
jgi:hypothetical protein